MSAGKMTYLFLRTACIAPPDLVLPLIENQSCIRTICAAASAVPNCTLCVESTEGAADAA